MQNDRSRTAYMIGLAFIGLGVLSILKGGFYNLGYYLDFQGYHVPFGITMCVFGILFLLTGIRRKGKQSNKDAKPGKAPGRKE